MQTTDLRLTAVVGRPETLHPTRDFHATGLASDRITYLVTGVPVDIPIFEVLHVCEEVLSLRANRFNAYEFTWNSLAMAAGR